MKETSVQKKRVHVILQQCFFFFLIISVIKSTTLHQIPFKAFALLQVDDQIAKNIIGITALATLFSKGVVRRYILHTLDRLLVYIFIYLFGSELAFVFGKTGMLRSVNLIMVIGLIIMLNVDAGQSGRGGEKEKMK